MLRTPAGGSAVGAAAAVPQHLRRPPPPPDSASPCTAGLEEPGCTEALPGAPDGALLAPCQPPRCGAAPALGGQPGLSAPPLMSSEAPLGCAPAGEGEERD